MWKSYLRDHADELGKEEDQLSVEERAEAGVILLDEFRKLADKRSNQFPESLLGLVEAWIEHHPAGGWTETATVVARQPPAEKTQPASD